VAVTPSEARGEAVVEPPAEPVALGAEGRQLFDEDSRTKLLVSAASLGAKLVAAAEAKQTFPDQQAERAAFHERMKQLVTFRREEWPCEYEYWRSAGRL